MRFTYRKIETAMDRAQKRSLSEIPTNSPEIPVSYSLKSSDSKPSCCTKNSYNCTLSPYSSFVLIGLFLTIAFLIGLKGRDIVASIPSQESLIRVRVHQEPIDKHLWLPEGKVIEIKSEKW